MIGSIENRRKTWMAAMEEEDEGSKKSLGLFGNFGCEIGAGVGILESRGWVLDYQKLWRGL